VTCPSRVVETVTCPNGREAYQCPHCRVLRPTVDDALRCCGERDLYEEGMRSVCWPVSSDPTVLRRTIRRLRRKHGVRP